MTPVGRWEEVLQQKLHSTDTNTKENVLGATDQVDRWIDPAPPGNLPRFVADVVRADDAERG